MREQSNQSQTTHLLHFSLAAGLLWKLVNLTAPNICKVLTFWIFIMSFVLMLQQFTLVEFRYERRRILWLCFRFSDCIFACFYGVGVMWLSRALYFEWATLYMAWYIRGPVRVGICETFVENIVMSTSKSCHCFPPFPWRCMSQSRPAFVSFVVYI